MSSALKYRLSTGEPAEWYKKAVFQRRRRFVRQPGRQLSYPFKDATLVDLSRYTGAILRQIRAERGVGRPPAVCRARRLREWEGI